MWLPVSDLVASIYGPVCNEVVFMGQELTIFGNTPCKFPSVFKQLGATAS